MLFRSLLKKTLLADPLASVVGPAFAAPSALSPLAAWTAALAWSFELYFDFSGYSDMAIGLARIFGVRFPENFDSPYKARSVIDYWQRWHMTLTRFLTGTIYNPLALSLMRWCRRRRLGGRGPGFSIVGFAAGHTVPIVATMLAVGLWHGLSWTYAVFGLMHAGFLIANHVWRTIRPHAEPAGWMGPATYLCVLAGAIVFKIGRAHV